MIQMLILLLWLPQIVIQLLLWVYWLQDKEYRFDRFSAFLNNLDGIRELGLVYLVTKLSVLGGLIIVNRLDWLYFAVLVIINCINFVGFVRHTLRRPVFTLRARRILSLSVIVIGATAVLLLATAFNPKDFVVLEVVSILVPFLGVWLTSFSVQATKKMEIAKMLKLLHAVHPVVIGITGSYGKTTTKDFVAQILGSKFVVAKNKGSENTDFGVIRNILTSVTQDTQFLVLEIGAYKKGEIAQLANLLTPKLAIITGIEPQHLDLFGSLDNIKAAKFEMVENLAENGVALFNFNNIYCRELAEKTRSVRPDVTVYGYATQTPVSDFSSAVMAIQSSAKNLITSTVSIPGEETSVGVQFQLPGKHFAENVLVAIFVGRFFKVPWSKITKVLKHLELPAKTMQVSKLPSGCVIIDDSYNSTPKGFESALAFLIDNYSGKRKVVITTGIIELGNVSDNIHKQLGKIMADKIDVVIIRNTEFEKAISAGLGRSKTQLQVISELPRLREVVNSYANNKNTVLLLEGKLPQVILIDLVSRIEK